MRNDVNKMPSTTTRAWLLRIICVAALAPTACDEAANSDAIGAVDDAADVFDAQADGAVDSQVDVSAAADAEPDVAADLPTTCVADCFVEPAMIALPGGTFSLGSTTANVACNATPVHQVTLSPFSLDKTEVTVGQYAAFYAQLAASQKCSGKNDAGFVCGQPDTAEGCTWSAEANQKDYPINCVDWFQANAYCAWAHKGGRLPTEAQFEYAARDGGKTQSFPWGEANPDCATNVIYLDSLKNNGGCGTGGPWPVCSRTAGNTTGGACDLAGNVGELCWDWYTMYDAKPQADPTGPATAPPGEFGYPPFHVIRGGGYSGNEPLLNTSCRAPLVGYPARSAHFGFRCAKDGT
jgi:sulfatase modifying factor 1